MTTNCCNLRPHLSFNNNNKTIDHIISACPILAREQYIKDMIECVHSYTSTYARKQGYNWTKNTDMNMCQNQ